MDIVLGALAIIFLVIGVGATFAWQFTGRVQSYRSAVLWFLWFVAIWLIWRV